MSPSQGRVAAQHPADWQDVAEALSAGVKVVQDNLPGVRIAGTTAHDERPQQPSSRDAFYILLPMLIVLSTFLFLLLLFLVCVILLRKRRGIMLRDNDGPVDMSREDLIEGEGGFEGVESRWLETVSEAERRAYLRAKGKYTISRVLLWIEVLTRTTTRVPASASTKLYADRYHIIPVSLHPGEGCLGMVVRAGL